MNNNNNKVKNGLQIINLIVQHQDEYKRKRNIK